MFVKMFEVRWLPVGSWSMDDASGALNREKNIKTGPWNLEVSDWPVPTAR